MTTTPSVTPPAISTRAPSRVDSVAIIGRGVREDAVSSAEFSSEEQVNDSWGAPRTPENFASMASNETLEDAA